MDYERDIEIDEQALDVEWLDHSRLMFGYCSHAAEMHRDMDLAKERLDIVKADLDLKIRSDPEGFGLAKVTESAIQAAIVTHPEHQEASQALIQKRYEYEVAQGAVRAFDHRKSALENLVRLHGQSYFAGPSVPHVIEDERRRREEQRAERDRSAQAKVRLRRNK